MATVINTTPAVEGRSSSEGIGFLLGVVLLILTALFLFYYGVPALRSMSQGANPGVNVNVPDKLDVNVNNPGNSQ
jgi:hypothetical protein